MRRDLYFGIVVLLSIPIVVVASNLIANLIEVRLESIDSIMVVLMIFFWTEYFNVKYNKLGLWQTVLPSRREKLSLVVHLVIFFLVTAWTNQIATLPIYRALSWLTLVYVTYLSFLLTSPKETKPLIKKYFSGKW